MEKSGNERSRITDNRMAVAIVIGSIVLVASLALLSWTGQLEYLVPEHGPAADTLPLYLLAAVAGIGLIIWGWKRVLSLLQ